MKGSDDVDEINALFQYRPEFTFTIGTYKFGVTKGLIIQWVILLILAVLCITMTRNLKKVPDKKQSILEMLVEFVNGIVKSTMGDDYIGFAAYIATVGIFLITMNLTGLLGFDAPTMDYSVTLGMGLTTFIIIQAFTIKRHGLLHYFGAFTQPILPLTPLNVLERIMLPVSLSLRLFGNMLASGVIMKLVYVGLSNIMPIAGQLVSPIPLHLYFDVFDGSIQMIIFTLLTMIQIKVTAEE